jgi:hypothetical protein
MDSSDNRKQQEAERYRKAAEAILETLDSAITYLHRIGKSRVAEALQQNRKRIAARLR